MLPQAPWMRRKKGKFHFYSPIKISLSLTLRFIIHRTLTLLAFVWRGWWWCSFHCRADLPCQSEHPYHLALSRLFTSVRGTQTKKREWVEAFQLLMRGFNIESSCSTSLCCCAEIESKTSFGEVVTHFPATSVEREEDSRLNWTNKNFSDMTFFLLRQLPHTFYNWLPQKNS